MTIKKGSVAALEYTLKDDEGNTIDSNVGGEPLEYTHGEGQIVIGLENALEGMAEGDSKEVKVSAEEGYGPVAPEAFIEVPKDNVPEDARVKGTELQVTDQDGRPMLAVVSEVLDDTVKLDFNHPLAGMTLHFSIKVLEIKN